MVTKLTFSYITEPECMYLLSIRSSTCVLYVKNEPFWYIETFYDRKNGIETRVGKQKCG